MVIIRIGSTDNQYRFPQALLCAQVPYFFASFKQEHFREGSEQLVTLKEIDGVVSARSFEMLVPWVCFQRLIVKELPPTEAITTLIEFARLTDYLGITDIASLIAEQMKRIILCKESLEVDEWETPQVESTLYLVFEHLESGINLPKGHAVRRTLASAVVKGFLCRDKKSLFRQCEELPDFAADLLTEMRLALATLTVEKRGMSFIDPIKERRTRL